LIWDEGGGIFDKLTGEDKLGESIFGRSCCT